MSWQCKTLTPIPIHLHYEVCIRKDPLDDPAEYDTNSMSLEHMQTVHNWILGRRGDYVRRIIGGFA